MGFKDLHLFCCIEWAGCFDTLSISQGQSVGRRDIVKMTHLIMIKLLN